MKRTQPHDGDWNDNDADDPDDDEEEEEDDDVEDMNIGEIEEDDDEDEEDLDGSKQQRHLLSLANNDGGANGDQQQQQQLAFMDSFYGISSADVRERTMAAQVLIHHCLLSKSTTTSTSTTTGTVTTTTTANDDTANEHDDVPGEHGTASAQIKDAAYALRRLMNGLCSGRAAARQGNAATLASFLQVAVVTTHQMQDIRREWYRQLNTTTTTTTTSPDYRNEESELEISHLSFIRDALISVTEPNHRMTPKTTKSGGGPRSRTPATSTTEERDSKLGRLFGITAVIRSGILQHLLLQPQSSETSDPMVGTTTTSTTTTDLWNMMQDLIQLYHYKKWIREAAAHAICSLLLVVMSSNRVAGTRLVDDCLVPQLLLLESSTAAASNTTTRDDSAPKSWVHLLSSLSVEQWAVAMTIQSVASNDKSTTWSLPPSVLLAIETIPYLTPALVATASTVPAPRIHFVWDVLWDYLSESIPNISATTTTKDTPNHRGWDHRRLKVALPRLPEGESVNDLVATIVQSVIVEGLMGISTTKDSGNNNVVSSSTNSSSKMTQDKYALALTLIRNFMSVPFTSTITQNQSRDPMVRLILTTEQIETMIFTPTIVHHLFLNVICTSGKGKPQSNKTLATEVLEQIVGIVLEDTRNMVAVRDTTEEWSSEYDSMIQKRITMAMILLRCDPRFDAKTKTPTVERLLGLTASVSHAENEAEETNVVFQSTWKPYVTFLEHEILGDSSATETRSSYQIQGYIDLMYQLGKTLSRNDAISDADGIQRVYGFLLTVAFFNCRSVEVADSTEVVTKKKKKHKRQSVPAETNTIIEIARMIQGARSNSSPILSYEVRSVASARFFSLLTDTITTIIHSSGSDKESKTINVLSDVHTMLSHLIGVGAKKIITITPSEDMDTDTDTPPEIVVKKMIDDAKACTESEIKDAAVRWKHGCAVLGSTLYLHLLTCGQPDIGNDENPDPNADDDEDYEETVGLLNDLRDIAVAYSNSGNASDNPPLPALAELCARILSSPLGVGNQSRGASPTLLRDAVKMAWTGGLSLSASLAQGETSALDNEVVNILLNALGAIDDTVAEDDEDDDSDDDEDDEENEDDPSTSQELQFPVAAAIDLDDDKMKIDEDDDESDEELQIDPDKLKTLLEEESDADADVDETELEHHEGADAALAKLIQLKQEARKAGTLAKERAEIARQIRCIVLLEVLVVGKDGNWGTLLRADLVMQMILPILNYRSEVAKSLSKALSKGSNVGSNEKAALLSKLTALLKTKILKAKISDMEWTESIDVSGVATTFVQSTLKQALDSEDKEHRSLCNSCIMYVLRCIADNSTKLKCASIYSDAVLQWSTKRTTRLDSTFFEELLHQSPVIAQACLTEALATAASNGRTTYLKSEAFRLLSMLYNPKLNASATDFDKAALARLTESTSNVLASISSSLNDVEMKKTKRIRDVLKAGEKVVHFLSVSSSCPTNCVEGLCEMTRLLRNIKDDSESHGIVNSVTALINNIDSLISDGGDGSHELTNDPTEPMDNGEDNPIDDMELESGAASKKSRKKKNKSKKKKK